jgi:RHS repeat-associated protein
MKKHYGLSLLPFLLMGLMMAPPRAKRPSGKQDVTSPKTDSQQKGTAVIGQSRTLMPDGHWLILGGETPTGFLNMGEIQDSSTGAVTPLAHGLSEARAWHTATLLPNGEVLVFGGLGADGRIVTTAELFDPSTQQFQLIATPGLTARAHHTATLLTDGSVLIVGGVRDSSQTLGIAELWNFQNGSGTQLPRGLLTPRHDHTATFLPDGEVLFWAGKDSQGELINYGEIFDPKSLTFRIQTTQAQAGTDAPGLEESIPADGSNDVPVVGVLIKLRFSKPLLVTTVNTTTVTLSEPSGTVPVQVVPAEGGMLAFVTPQSPLVSATSYSLVLSGLTDSSGNALPQTIVYFTTAGTALGVNDVPIPGAGNGGNQSLGAQSQNLPPLQAPPGVTALSGRSLKLNGSPLENLTIQDENSGVKAETDETGRFLLRPLNAGHHVLFVDGRTAKSAKQVYGTYEIGVDILASQTNVLSYTIWMTALDTAHAVAIASPTTTDVVISNPSLPGLELHIPKGTVITDHDGKIVRQVSISPISLTQPPFPLPQGVQVPIYFTIQPGAAYLTVNGGAGWEGAQLYYPNQGKSAPGTRFDFWNYNPNVKGWYIYGHGTVSADGKQVIPDPGVQIYEFTGAMVGGPSMGPPTGPPPSGSSSPAPPGGPPPSPAPPPIDGDPVSLSTGLFDYSKTDLVISDVLPVSLTRAYRPGDSMSRAFGVGTTHAFDMFLVGETISYSYSELILPDGSRIRYDRISSGSSYANAVYVHTSTTTMYYGSVITWNGAGWNLTLRNGTVYIFPDGYGATIPQQCALIGIKDRYGNTVTITRDSNHNLTQITTPNNRWIQFTYDSSNRITQAKDNIGRTVSYSYDSGGRLSTVTDAKSGVTTYTYDSNGNMLTITDPRNLTYLTNQYDSNNRVFKQTMADGSTYQFSYTLNGNSSQTHFVNLASSYSGAGPGKDITGFRACQGCSEGYTTEVSQVDITDQRGIVRRVMFSLAGYTISDTHAVDQPEEQTTTYQYYPDNLLKSVTDPLGRTTTFVYDINNDVTQATRLSGTPDAITTTSTYESTFNQVKTVTDPLAHTTTFTYDSNGNLVAVNDPLNQETSFTYNAAGQPLTATDPLSHTTSFAYDSGDLVSITDPLSRTVTRFLDGAGRLVTVTNPLGQSTRNDYDALNEITKVTDPAGNATSFTYDGNGNLLSVTDANSHATTYTYDSMDRLLTRTDPLTNTERYQYDAAGNLIQFTDRRGKITTYTYDSLNRKTLAGFGTAVGTPTTYDSTITYSYDTGNRLASAVDSVTGTITPTYDKLDRIISEQTAQGAVSYTYDAAGRRTQMTVAGQAGVNYAYDNANRLMQITQGSSTVSFGYDSGNRRTSLTLPNGIVMSYGYDNASQLTGITYTNGGTTLGTLTYAYDLAGRRTQMGGSYAQIGLPLAINEAEYNANNQLTEWGTAGLYYDANGNMTSDGMNSFVWNTRNQLASMDSSLVSFQYDSYARRSGKTVSGVTTNYLYDGANIAQEISGGSPIANLLLGGTDEVFTRTDSSGTANFLTNALGSTLALTDGSGTTLASYAYEPFGNTTVTSGSSTNEFEYTGRENDGTGLYFYRERYYNPTLQRFITEDPLEFAAGVNFYGYVSGNPISIKDPSGLDWKYSQGSGAIYKDTGGIVVYVGSGYSGHGNGVNNPDDQFIPNVGPIPQGTYTIGPQQNHVIVHPDGTIVNLPGSMILTPDPSNDMGDPPRSGFLIHGGNMVDQTSSAGCIVLPPAVRNVIANSGDDILKVKP